MNKNLNVLFLCTGNSCRSQMAEGFARALKADQYHAYSAGTRPQGLNPLAVKVMAEAGINLQYSQSKHINELADINFDLIVSVCDSADQNCPVLLGKTKRLQHFFADPPKLAEGCLSESEALPFYRKVRDQIKQFIEATPGIFFKN